ncbi:MAG: Hsp20/alpha crystallin family protein [Candidatus Verstraetearchaeota archaeon]|nr:Hsp20/alpha crystallin family protein [Candidatus Verstraetearchaeota archaeon]
MSGGVEMVFPTDYHDIHARLRAYMDGCLEPLTEVQETENELIVRVDMPCVRSKDEISVNLTEDTVSVEARMEKSVQYERWGTFQRAVRFFKYSKTFTLPVKVDPERARARFVKNVLELRLPKKGKVFRIEIH